MEPRCCLWTTGSTCFRGRKMDIRDVILARRSIRRLEDGPVDPEKVRWVLEAGRHAPTGGNMQPWEFVVVRDRHRIGLIKDTTFLGFNRETAARQEWLAGADVLICVCADYKRTVARYGEMGRRIALMDCAAAVENMLLMAVSLGLGSCWVSGFDDRALAVILELPPGVEPVAVLPLGCPAAVQPAPHKLELEDIVSYERYGRSQDD